MRIYPVPLEVMDFSKFDWIELDLQKRSDDFRPETFEPVNKHDLRDLEVVDHVGTGKNRDWTVRKELCCRNTYYSLAKLIEDSKPPQRVSLATFKPAELLELTVEPTDRDWKKKWRIQRKTPQLFDAEENRRSALIGKVPYKFRYRFRDADGRESELKIIDWELGQLYWNCLERAEGDEEVAIAKVREKYFDTFSEKDLYLFLGTTKQFHNVAPNPFIIIGVFYPPIDPQGDLFTTI